MNKHEIIRVFKDLKKSGMNKLSVDSVLNYLDQLYEPGQVTLPNHVHVFIKDMVNDKVDLIRALNLFLVDKENREWIEQGNNQELFACGYMFGSKAQESARYSVRVKSASAGNDYLNCYISLNEWGFSNANETNDYRIYHTREQLDEAGFGWVFNCPGIECIEKENE